MHNKLQKRLLVVGGSGLIGSHISKKCEEFNLSYRSTYFSNKKFKNQIKFDLNDIEKIHNLISSNDMLIFCSAVANPNWVFKNQKESYDLNVNKTINFLNKIKSKVKKIIFLSSVEVFDGKKGNYKENDTKNPLNFYGMTKEKVEDHIENNFQDYCIIRTGWNIGMDPKQRCVIKLTYQTLLKENAKMAEDNFFTITHVEDFASNLLKIIGIVDDKIIHLSSDHKLSRTELADYIIKNSKLGPKMKFQSIKFENINFDEPRSRLNDLNNDLSRNKYNLKFRDPFKTIDQKIKILDDYFSKEIN